jgi:hypothetical protein
VRAVEAGFSQIIQNSSSNGHSNPAEARLAHQQGLVIMRHPLVYEINTRCWLRELSAQHGRSITLGSVPESAFQQRQELGFTHIWLMGVWTVGQRSRAAALNNPALRRSFHEALPDWKESDVTGSPFAIGDYKVPRAMGGEAGLEAFRARLHTYGLKLLLDFVPNHVGLDHQWLVARPDLFVQATERSGESFFAETSAGPRWIAHGKDPNFPAWIDTAQLDYRRADTRTAMIEQLQSIARRCDGVRCDMAMLLLNEVFARTWEQFPCSAAATEREFWADAVQVIKRSRPDFLFLAEVYWDLEARLQSLGFDYTYDKRLYDYLVYRDSSQVQRHLLGVTAGFIDASAHFLENHDEARIATILSATEHRPAALLTLGLPGLRLLYEGQLNGARVRTPIQLGRRPAEPSEPEIESLYLKLLATLKGTAVGQGERKILAPRPAWPGNSTAQNFVVVEWQTQSGDCDLVVVNLAAHRSQCYVTLTAANLSRHNWEMRDLIGEEIYHRSGDDLQEQGLYLDLPAHGAQLFRFKPAI